jgi:hypothetical protein
MIEIADAAQCTYRAWFGPTVSGCLSDWAISACRKAHNSSARAKWVHSPMRTFCSQARQGDGDVYPLVGGQWKRVVQLLFRWPTAVFTDLTPNATCGRLAKRRNPDQGAKCALLVNIQGPSLAEADLNAPGIGVVPGQSRSFVGRLSPFPPSEHALNKTRQPRSDRKRPRLAYVVTRLRHPDYPGGNT